MLVIAETWAIGERNVLVWDLCPTTDLYDPLSNGRIIPAGSHGNTEIHKYFISHKNDLGA